MTKSFRGALAVFIAAVIVGTPVVAEANSRGNQLEAEIQTRQLAQTETVAVRGALLATEQNLYWKRVDKDLTDQELKRKQDELAGAHKQIEQLKKDVGAARADRPVARLETKARVGGGAVTVKADANVNIGKSGNCESYRGLVAAHFPASQVNNALFTMKKESGCRANAVSPANDYGLMQINFRSHSKRVGGNAKLLFDPATNVRVAAQIYRESGWCPWVAVRGTLC